MITLLELHIKEFNNMSHTMPPNSLPFYIISGNLVYQNLETYINNNNNDNKK